MMRHTRGMAIALILMVALVATAIFSLRTWAGLRGQEAGADIFRYRFARPPRGSVVKALQDEIAFYQQRAGRTPAPGLDLAFLAGTYLKMARTTGDLRWYLLAEQTARRSQINLPFHSDAAVAVLARVAEARHDFDEAMRLAHSMSGSQEGLSILVTANLAVGRVAEAARHAEALVGQAPSLGSYTLRALVDIARGQDALASTDFKQALSLEEMGEPGGSAYARTLLGRLHYRRGNLPLAEALYREALRILPQYPLALGLLGELEIRRGAYLEAERHYVAVVTLTKESPNIFDHMVLRGLARVKELRGDHRRAADLRAEAELRLRQDVSRGAFGHRRELARLLLERGRAGDAAEALALMRAEVRLRRDAETLDTLAWALMRSGNWREARHAMRAALRWGLRDAPMFYRSALIEEALGDRAAASRFYRLARETDPTLDERTAGLLGLGGRRW